MHQHHRRRKKRPNYGIRTVEVSRGYNGFGFTITGQQPCILSCIVPNSPADQAGLRAGDFLISVNGLNVSKIPHESVVQLIGNSLGTIRMQIAENYFSDSSDEENAVNQINRGKPRYLHHKLKMNRLRNSPQKIRDSQGAGSSSNREQLLRPVIEDPPLHAPSVPVSAAAAAAAHNIIHSPNASTSKDITNVSAMVRSGNVIENSEIGISLEYRAIVGYLGTIEMPKQIATSSKLQTVRSCIRKMRQEKRNPTTVLMTILPNCLTLRSCKSAILASYPSSRLNYVSSSSESENRFFGLVTNTVHSANADDDDDECSDSDPNNQNIRGAAAISQREVIISNSCHVFVVDTKLCDHIVHEPKAMEFRITCTKDPISNLCLEFPNNSEYVVNLIRSMYTMRVLPPINRNIGNNRNIDGNGARNPHDGLQANSPQPSNHSEVTTTSSNSDSGIGFHNDCTNISDRILVVDFPGIHLMANRINPLNGNIRPLGICNNFGANNEIPIACGSVAGPSEDKSKYADGFNTRLTVRAMPDPKTPPPIPHNGPDLLSNFDLIKSPASSLTATRSCDNVLSLISSPRDRKSIQLSMDDISMLSSNHMPSVAQLSSSYPKEHVFMPPSNKSCNKKQKKPDPELEPVLGNRNISTLKKLSPKVFAMPSKTNSVSVENLTSVSRRLLTEEPKSKFENFEIWGSLQDIYKSSVIFQSQKEHLLEGTYSEPDLPARAITSNTSPFRRWGQSSFRTTKPTESRASNVRRPSSLAASDNDVYTKSMDNFISDLNTARSQSGDVNSVASYSIQIQPPDHNGGVVEWGNSFEKLLEDPAGIHTFAEFLKKEFSAENIYFWTACERYRQIDSDSERAIHAMDIFSKHLANGALEPVNVDSQARNTAEDNLKAADRSLFSQAQKQIFNLMKFDSYQRFIRSDFYKKCLDAEEKKLPLPYPGDELDELLKTSLTTSCPSKLKKSVSNAEDRRRKSLLPWHRKTRCKSRDRSESDVHSNRSASGKSQLSGNSLKLPMTNSTSDIHSSRSSLSSFDATATVGLGSGSEDAKATCSLCRVILCDGATTIVQLRPDETVRQLVERLLEKRGISYQMFDVIFNGCTKSIDLENPAHILAGKEVQIEQRVAFKLDLPDPKVISVKSKPKKVLCEVVRPILQKYNYRMEDVQILLRDTQEQMDLSLPVTVADGQRLQVVMLKMDRHCYLTNQQHVSTKGFNYLPPIKQSQILKAPLPTHNSNINSQQSTLDEITNKVFNELLQGKVEAHHNQSGLQTKNDDQTSLKSEGCASETSSIFERLRRRDSNIPGFKGLRPKKENLSSKTLTTTQSDDTLSNITHVTSGSDPNAAAIKKPLIAKWKTGVKVQVTERTEKQDEFIEGLKRAQRARLEDQRGTEINFELPDFLKNKENLNAANKLRKIRANLSPINKTPSTVPFNSIETQLSPTKPISNSSNDDNVSISFVSQNSITTERPQPAPRLSITKKLITSPTKVEETPSRENSTNELITPKLCNNLKESDENLDASTKGPPPLPPKPKVLPIKPSNWGQNTSSSSSNTSSTAMNLSPIHTSNKPQIESTRRHLGSEQSGRSAYLDQPSSSFV